jgi:hypothetical protein
VRISRQNQRLLFGLMWVVLFGLIIGRALEKSMDALGEKRRVLALAEPLAQCATREQYLAFLDQHCPSWAALERSSSPSAPGETTTSPARLEQLRDGRLKVTVPIAISTRGWRSLGHVYLPAALVDEGGCGRRLVDVRLNSRKSDMVLEYYFAGPSEARGAPARRFYFFMGRRQWELRPSVRSPN